MGKLFISFNILSFGLLTAVAFAADAEPKTVAEILSNKNLFTVRRELWTLQSKPGPEQGHAWAALVALERLTGHPERALKLIEACKEDCVGRVPKDEKSSIRLWVCGKEPKQAICK